MQRRNRMSKNEVLVITKKEVLAWWETLGLRERDKDYPIVLDICQAFGAYIERGCEDFDDAQCHLCKRITEFRKEVEEE
jgi:hypothetical protein